MNVLLAICIILSMSSGVTVYAEENSGGGQAGEIEIIDSSMASEYLEIMQNEITIDNNKYLFQLWLIQQVKQRQGG